jgi:glycosyltransferase involved in cell wall biosynthesis
MKISIVIPVYNEVDQLSTCLDAIAAQTTKPFEVIVVDNNSTDGTGVIANKYDFVTLVNEEKQGVVHARTLGFDTAHGDIIARIDGDSVLPCNWVENVEEVFNDKTVDAVSGVALYYGVAGETVINAIDIFFRRRLSHGLRNNMYLWGANMAIRRDAWKKIRETTCQRGDQHEDFDIAIHLQEIGGKIIFDERLVAEVSSRRIEMNFFGFMRYVWISPSTYAQHGIKVKRQLYPVVALCALLYFPGYILHKGYDPDLDRFSLSKLLASTATVARVDPTANVA